MQFHTSCKEWPTTIWGARLGIVIRLIPLFETNNPAIPTLLVSPAGQKYNVGCISWIRNTMAVFLGLFNIGCHHMTHHSTFLELIQILVSYFGLF